MKPFYEAVAWLVVHIHAGLAPLLGVANGWGWALSIVVLTVAMRLALVPLFVRQTTNQRAMQQLQPKMKELQAKYKGDKEKLNQELMSLWAEHGANPLTGCLPLIVQAPIFFALFRVLSSIKPRSNLPSAALDCSNVANFRTCFGSHYGIDYLTVGHFANAKIFGVPVAAAFNSTNQALQHLAASATSTKILAAVLLGVTVITTFLTQRQMLVRSTAGSQTSEGTALNQKALPYVLPLAFLIFSFRFQVGVLLYWLTTNLWTMGQQHFVLRAMAAAPSAELAAPEAHPDDTGEVSTPPGPSPTDARRRNRNEHRVRPKNHRRSRGRKRKQRRR